MCVRHVILLIVQTDHVLEGAHDVNAGWPAMHEGTAHRRQTHPTNLLSH